MTLLRTGVKVASHETKTYADDLNDGTSFILRMRGVQRIRMRSARGRETLVQQRNIGMNKARELEYTIDPTCLVNEESCRGLVELLLMFSGIPDKILECVVPSIYKEAIELTRYREENGGRGFLIVTEAVVIEEFWICDDSEDHQRNIQTEQDGSCAICLEPLVGSSRTMDLCCSHIFHRDCLFQWLAHDLSCPICRYDDIQ